VAQPGVDPNRLGAVAWNDSFAAVAKLGATGKVTAVYPEPIESQNCMTEQAWVDIYEFLGKHVEDANLAACRSDADRPDRDIAPIASEQGVRGRPRASWQTSPQTMRNGNRRAPTRRSPQRRGISRRCRRQRIAGRLASTRDRFQGSGPTLRGRAPRLAAAQTPRELPRACAACHVDYRQGVQTGYPRLSPDHPALTIRSPE
jgi:hypothetical protein